MKGIRIKSAYPSGFPSQIGIQGNDKADSAAKSTPKMSVDNAFRVPYTDLKRKNMYIYSKEMAEQQCSQ